VTYRVQNCASRTIDSQREKEKGRERERERERKREREREREEETGRTVGDNSGYVAFQTNF